MKKKLSIVVMISIIILFSSCETPREKRLKRSAKMLKIVENLRVDSCQYDKSGNILCFSSTNLPVKRTIDGNVIVENDTFRKNHDEELIKKVTDVLKRKWSSPETYSSVCVRKFKNLIENLRVDSCSITEIQRTIYYEFFLEEYSISIIINGFLPLRPSEDMYISTEKKGIFMSEFSDIDFEWPIIQKKELLTTLLIKSKEKTFYPDKKDSKTTFFPLRYEKNHKFSKEEILSKLK